VSTVLKSGSLNLLESYGPVQACNGIALRKFVKHLADFPLNTPSSHNSAVEDLRFAWHGISKRAAMTSDQDLF
jgi:hypothetical protein